MDFLFVTLRHKINYGIINGNKSKLLWLTYVITVPTEINKIPQEEDSFTVIVEFDLLEYRKKHSSKSVKKTLSIPEWLNEEAVARGVNFSQVLQDALKLQLGL